jgi:hypothetical protein
MTEERFDGIPETRDVGRNFFFAEICLHAERSRHPFHRSPSSNQIQESALSSRNALQLSRFMPIGGVVPPSLTRTVLTADGHPDAHSACSAVKFFFFDM